jgi:hypothetical protein
MEIVAATRGSFRQGDSGCMATVNNSGEGGKQISKHSSTPQI